MHSLSNVLQTSEHSIHMFVTNSNMLDLDEAPKQNWHLIHDTVCLLDLDTAKLMKLVLLVHLFISKL